MPLLSVDRLSTHYPATDGTVRAVDDVSLEIVEGETVALVGESGCGKSTLGKSLMRLVNPTSGQVTFKGRDVAAMSGKELRSIRRHIQMIFQDPFASLNPRQTIRTILTSPLAVHGIGDRKSREAIAASMVVHVGLPADSLDRYPHEFSGGQRQRIGIARALILQPELVICDEPVSALDLSIQAQILNLLVEMKTELSLSYLFISHDLSVVRYFADRVLVMYLGRIVESAPTARLWNEAKHPYTQALIAAVPALAPPPREPAADSQPVLSISGLCKSYGNTRALHDASLDLARGTTLSVVGESGSGKTTLAKLTVRLIEPTGGDIAINGKSFLGAKGAALRQQRRNVQMIFQDPYGSLNPRRRVGDTIARAAVLAGATGRDARAKAHELLELVGLTPEAYFRRPSAFSGGQRQRIGIARALAMGPDILIADESVSALDVSVQTQILALLQELQAKFGLSILFITHDLRVAAQISDRVVVMKNGQIVEAGDAMTVLTAPQHPYTRELIAAAPGRGIV